MMDVRAIPANTSCIGATVSSNAAGWEVAAQALHFSCVDNRLLCNFITVLVPFLVIVTSRIASHNIK